MIRSKMKFENLKFKKIEKKKKNEKFGKKIKNLGKEITSTTKI